MATTPGINPGTTPPAFDTSQLSGDQLAQYNMAQELNRQSAQSSMLNMYLQQQQHEQQEKFSTLSTIMKNAHDAKMNIINNAKG